jgi:hypothetical protein
MHVPELPMISLPDLAPKYGALRVMAVREHGDRHNSFNAALLSPSADSDWPAQAGNADKTMDFVGLASA